MAAKHDFVDDLIDISKGFGSLKDPLNGLSAALMGNDSSAAPVWNPSEYKERPRANTIPCLVCRDEKSTCTKCKDVCPVEAIEFDDDEIDILDTCRKCGLCVAVCPTEALSSPTRSPKSLYDQIAQAATAHTRAYVTCARAIKRIPRDNEVVVGCLGDITRETWFAILVDYPNVRAYLPLDVCTKCRTTTGEEVLGNAIADAEEWAGTGLGLVVDADKLVCKKRRSVERKEFMEGVARTTGLTVSKLNPAASAAATLAQKFKAHGDRIASLQRTLDATVGVTAQQRHRVLTEGRQLLLSTLQEHPELAKNVQVKTPVWNAERCTMCGACAEKCPTLACDITKGGKFTFEPSYCVGCGLCVDVCKPHALKLKKHDAQALVVPDPDAEKKAAEAKRSHEEAQKARDEAKKKLNKALDQIEKLAD